MSSSATTAAFAKIQKEIDALKAKNAKLTEKLATTTQQLVEAKRRSSRVSRIPKKAPADAASDPAAEPQN